MQNMYTPPWAYAGDTRQTAPSITYIYYSQIPVYLGGKPGTERVVLYTSNTGLNAKAEIQKYDETLQKWMVEYIREGQGFPYFNVLSGYWETIRQNAVVLYSVTGSGGYLNYTAIARNNDKLTEYVDRKEIFQGAVWFEGASLAESEGIRYKIWKYRNRRLALVPLQIPRIAGSVVIRFFINQKGEIEIIRKNYTVPAGSTVQLVRTDTHPMVERILFSYNPNIKFIPHRNAFIIPNKSKIEFSIIPGGYDWEDAINITVTAH